MLTHSSAFKQLKVAAAAYAEARANIPRFKYFRFNIGELNMTHWR
jgi:hypothetical protein